MPKKYRVEVRSAPPRFSPIPKHSSLEISRCLGCVRCVKSTSCVYGVYRSRGFDPVQVQDTGDNLCVGCLRCVQECKNAILSRVPNPRFERMGDSHWTPDILARIWKQAETGKIPVSGAGYRGPFSGPGFDRMWTDMSEIVRPTRDGIHGREYISTAIDLGRKPDRLCFDADGNLAAAAPPMLEISLPAVLDVPPVGYVGPGVRLAMARAAERLETVVVATLEEARGLLASHAGRLIVRVDPDRAVEGGLEGLRIAELADSPIIEDRLQKVLAAYPDLVVSVRVPLDERAPDRAKALVRAGAGIVHLQAGRDGCGLGGWKDRVLLDLVKAVHLKLVEESTRDQVSLLVSGGIAMAEHLAKTIICGADAVGVDLALAAALECRLCPDCRDQIECPVRLDQVEEEWGAQRIVNLLGAWHAQLIEVMGAMGLREVRRLRGEVGRAMFFEDLERECFGPIFGRRRDFTIRVPHWRRGGDGGEGPAEDAFPWSGEDLETPFTAEAKRAPSRFRNRLAKYAVRVQKDCTLCGVCVQACRYGVLSLQGGRVRVDRDAICRGPEVCRRKGSFCGDRCLEQAIEVSRSPLWETFGDYRWTPDLIASTWLQAETGLPPVDSGLEYRTGASGGGFDRMDFAFPEKPPNPSLRPSQIDLRIPLNRRRDGRPQVTIGFPVYGGGMSFGSISLATMLARAKAYSLVDSFTCTGEGGYPDGLTRYDDHVITQVATGLFGVREETIQRVRIVELKYAQGAKPGLGGHLLGDKVTPAVARKREAVAGMALFSPFPFHSVYSVEDHKKHVDWIKAINPRALVSVKVSTPSDVDMVAIGSYYAGAHILHLDGSYGGTGAAPDIAKKNIATPIEYAIPKVHRFLLEEGVRDQMSLIVSGGLRTAWDIAKAIALGADGVVVGTAELVALECVRCGNCESGRGCPRGIATTDPGLSALYEPDWAAQRILNLFHSWYLQLCWILWRFGMRSICELVGRSDLLVHRDYEERPPRRSETNVAVEREEHVRAA